jgi:hypothetical protein
MISAELREVGRARNSSVRSAYRLLHSGATIMIAVIEPRS